VGRAAARRNAPKQPRAIRVGPHQGGQKLGLNTGVYLYFFLPYRGFIKDNIKDKPSDFLWEIRKPPGKWDGQKNQINLRNLSENTRLNKALVFPPDKPPVSSKNTDKPPLFNPNFLPPGEDLLTSLPVFLVVLRALRVLCLVRYS